MAGASKTPVPRTTVVEVVACLDAEFEQVASAVARGEYLLWLGSGLSRGVVPDVRTLLMNLLSFLQMNVDRTDDECRFAKALNDIFLVSGIPSLIRDGIDISTAVETWPGLDDLIARLVDNYSTVLDVAVDGEERDFLVWKGIDVPSTYGDPDLEPDVEHLCVAILMMEGLVRSAPTTNWDGLVEAAVDRLAGGIGPILRIVVRPNDFTAQQARSELVKFHGCAVKAAADPATYRRLLIARKSQISGWTTKPENQMMKAHLEHLLSSQPALVIGLSAQDADIHTMLHQARQNLVREWPATPPAAVFAVESLDYHHTHMLEVTYGDSYHANRLEIEASALLGAYAKPALLGLVLFTLAAKVCSLIVGTNGLAMGEADIHRLQDGVRALRNEVGGAAGTDLRAFTDRLVAAVSLVLSVFRLGAPPDPDSTHYEPLTVMPIADAQADPNFPGNALGRLAIAVSLLGRGLADGSWELEVGNAGNPDKGVVRVVPPSGDASNVFIVRDAGVLSKLEANGYVDMADPAILVIHADDLPVRFSRSPKGNYGRTGKRAGRELDIETISSDAVDADDLFENFKRKGEM